MRELKREIKYNFKNTEKLEYLYRIFASKC